jgi:hypothetical protein
VARSARHGARSRPARALGSLAACAAVAALAGCSTTQQEAARLQLNSARIRASEDRTRVTAPGRVIRVAKVALVTGAGRTAFVVRVQNPTSRPVSDLPISVGVRLGSKPPVYLNTRSPDEYSYFDAHLPLVAAGATLTWVYTTSRHLAAHSRPFAIVGATPSPPAPTAAPLPVIRASALGPSGAPGTVVRPGAASLPIALQNLSAVPQYQLQVYAVARRAGRYVAAGNLTVPHLGSQARRTLKLSLLGSLDHAQLWVEALPTIFQ